jgi:hypothetical protein
MADNGTAASIFLAPRRRQNRIMRPFSCVGLARMQREAQKKPAPK